MLVIGFSTVSITSSASLSTSTKTGKAGCYPYRHLCEPGLFHRFDYDNDNDYDYFYDLLQRKGDIGIAAPRTHFAAAAGDHDKLSAVDRIGGRRGIAAGGQLGLP